MRKILFCIALVVVAASVIARGTVVGTKHDLSSTGAATGKSNNVTEVCVFCHTPHQASTSADPLWNHTRSSTAAYGVYASATLNATPAEIADPNNPTPPVSNLCMSCHDGTVGLGSLYNNPGSTTPSNSATNISGTANLGTDLTNDHPVNFTYDTALVTADGGLVAVASLPTWALIGGQVQCSSCHDPHDNTNAPFLTTSNTNSALCTTCHTK